LRTGSSTASSAPDDSFSIKSNTSYITIAITEITMMPANISGVLRDELADIIR
jgi:hypothetical protein